MGQYTALLDANILYPAPMRDLFLQLALADLFRARWSADIHREWIESLLRNEPHRDRAKLERTRELMDQSTRDSLVSGYEALIPALSLPDAGDRHVLAAAIAGHCDVIVTQNLIHFPESALSRFDIKVEHPDAFLHHHVDVAPAVFCGAVRKVRARLLHPPYTVDQYLDTLSRQGLVATAGELRSFAEFL
ncbi:MAG: PIN domain-containing protein [Bryobacterales bacterium]|nr:PIN domain-containing protein [Bryobacterales bacterium]